MTPQEINEITKVVNDYRDKKNELLNERLKIEQQQQNGKILVWQKDYLIGQLYQNLFDTQEGKNFAELAKRAYKDAEFEKYFRAAHLKAFFNINVDPKTL